MSQAAIHRRGFLRGTITLAGASVALPALSALGGCAKAPASLDPLMPVVNAIADRIIPVTDTPGALAAGVPAYVAAVFTDHLTAEQQDAVIEGLTAIDQMAKDTGAPGFADMPAAEQDAMLTTLSQDNESSPATDVWRQLRSTVIFGFYTSEQALEEMPYEAVPGRYIACLPLAEVGGAWLDRGV